MIITGHALTWALSEIDLGGCDVVNVLMRLLTERGYSLTTTAEREICRGVNMTHCAKTQRLYYTLIIGCDGCRYEREVGILLPQSRERHDDCCCDVVELY